MRFTLKTKCRLGVLWGIRNALFCLVPLAWLILAQTPALGDLPDIPNVVGHKLAAAQGILHKNKLPSEAIAEKTFFPGEHLKVFRQYPRAGSPPGGWNGVVKIWYYDKDLSPKAADGGKDASKSGTAYQSRISKMVSVPELNGLTLDQALQELSDAGLVADIAGSVFTGNRNLLLKVAYQNPAPGTLMQPNSQVSIYLFRLRDYKTPLEIQKERIKKNKEKEKVPSGRD